jgi:O-antigen/teichoic acid export membrane protein
VLSYAPVLMVSIFVTDRIAVSQWALTRTIAGLLKGLCVQMTLPLAAELGQDHAAGLKDRVASLYVRGSVLLTVFVSTITSAAFVFWPDFFALWTNGSIPYNFALTATLLLGTCVGAPSILALSYANYSNRGYLLLWTKTLQLGIFLLGAVVLIPVMGPLGAAIAVVSSDIIVQLGILSSIIGGETLKRPVRHSLFLYATMASVLAAGIALGDAIRWLIPGGGAFHFLIESALWVATVAGLASPLAKAGIRQKLLKLIAA